MKICTNCSNHTIVYQGLLEIIGCDKKKLVEATNESST